MLSEFMKSKVQRRKKYDNNYIGRANVYKI